MVMLPVMGIPSNRDFSRRTLAGLWENMVAANDEFVQDLMDRGEAANRHGGRSNGYNFAMLAAGYACRDSRFYKNPLLVDLLVKTTDNLIKKQRPDGTINAGNLESPPDTAFIMEPVCAGTFILSQIEDTALAPLMEKIKIFVVRVGAALVIGGIRSPMGTLPRTRPN